MMQNDELITVGIPVYNGEKYLSQAIESICGQSHKNLEILISDDASIDDSLKICQRYVKTDFRISVFKQEKTLGPAANYNFLLNKAKGKYFFWIGQDDYIHEKCLEKLLLLLKKNAEAVLAAPSFRYLKDEKTDRICPPNLNATNVYNQLLKFIKRPNSSLFYGLHLTTSLRESGGYHSDSRPFFKAGDFVSIWRMLLSGLVVSTDEVLFHKRETSFYLINKDFFQHFKINKHSLKACVQSLFLPIYYIFDFFYCAKFLFLSNLLNSSEKKKVSGFLIVFLLKSIFIFIRDLFIGVFLFLKLFFREFGRFIFYLTLFSFSIPARIKGVKFGKNSYIGPGYDFLFVNLRGIVLGDNVAIGRNVWFQTAIINHKQSEILIGSNTQIGRNSMISAISKITIGKNCLFSFNVTILDADHELNMSSNSPIGTGMGKPKDVVIGDNCFIGAHSFILKGVTLGEHCAVGANSVVTRSFGDGCVVGGNPAKIIKKL